MSGILSRLATPLRTVGLRTCGTCRQGECLTREEFAARVSVRSPDLGGAVLSWTDHPLLKEALGRGALFVRCRRDGNFLERSDSCEHHELVGLRTGARRVVRTVIYGDAPSPDNLPRSETFPAPYPPTAPDPAPPPASMEPADASSAPPVGPRPVYDIMDEPDPQPTDAPDPEKHWNQACGMCGLMHDRCRACKMPRGICAQCSCGRRVRYDRIEKTWACDACSKHGVGLHPSMPLQWPQGYCDACRDRELNARLPDPPAPGTFGSAF